jgi:IS5 family transposase
MDSFDSYLLRRAYKKIAKLGGRLAKADRHINWEKFRPIVSGIYRNGSEGGGRPNLDEVVMVKLLVLQRWIGYSLER